MTEHDLLTQRLRDAGRDLRVSDEARLQHLAAIETALTEPGTVVPIHRAPSLRRRAAAAAAAVLVLGPGGVAAASADALPGDLLYPTKRVVESAMSVFDGDVSARHRIEELESLLVDGGGDGFLATAWSDAAEAVDALPEDHPLRQEYGRLLADATQPASEPSAPVIFDESDGEGDDSVVEEAGDDVDDGVDDSATDASGDDLDDDVDDSAIEDPDHDASDDADDRSGSDDDSDDDESDDDDSDDDDSDDRSETDDEADDDDSHSDDEHDDEETDS